MQCIECFPDYNLSVCIIELLCNHMFADEGQNRGYVNLCLACPRTLFHVLVTHNSLFTERENWDFSRDDQERSDIS